MALFLGKLLTLLEYFLWVKMLQPLLGWGWGLVGIWYGMLTWSPGWQFGDMTSGGQQGSVSEMSISFQRTVLFFKTQLLVFLGEHCREPHPFPRL